MTLYPIETGNFKLDGGAMFGVVPKALWSRTNPADNNNMIDIAARSLLIEDGDRLILIDTGCLLYTSPSPRDRQKSRMPSSA